MRTTSLKVGLGRKAKSKTKIPLKKQKICLVSKSHLLFEYSKEAWGAA
jgi:hypothetical protein